MNKSRTLPVGMIEVKSRHNRSQTLYMKPEMALARAYCLMCGEYRGDSPHDMKALAKHMLCACCCIDFNIDIDGAPSCQRKGK